MQLDVAEFFLGLDCTGRGHDLHVAVLHFPLRLGGLTLHVRDPLRKVRAVEQHDGVGRRTARPLLRAFRTRVDHTRTRTAHVMHTPLAVRLKWRVVVAERVILHRRGLGGGGRNPQGDCEYVAEAHFRNHVTETPVEVQSQILDIDPVTKSGSRGTRAGLSLFGSESWVLRPDPSGARHSASFRRIRIRPRAVHCRTTTWSPTAAIRARSSSTSSPAVPVTTRCRCRSIAASPAACSSVEPYMVEVDGFREQRLRV